MSRFARLAAALLLVATSASAAEPEPEWRYTIRPGDTLIGFSRQLPLNFQTECNTTIATHEAVIAVADHGPGVAPERQAKLFQRFSRTGNGVESLDGTGLGLYFVRIVAEKHGGSVAVSSKTGRTQFTMRLPLATLNQVSA